MSSKLLYKRDGKTLALISKQEAKALSIRLASRTALQVGSKTDHYKVYLSSSERATLRKGRKGKGIKTTHKSADGKTLLAYALFFKTSEKQKELNKQKKEAKKEKRKLEDMPLDANHPIVSKLLDGHSKKVESIIDNAVEQIKKIDLSGRTKAEKRRKIEYFIDAYRSIYERVESKISLAQIQLFTDANEAVDKFQNRLFSPQVDKGSIVKKLREQVDQIKKGLQKTMYDRTIDLLPSLSRRDFDFMGTHQIERIHDDANTFLTDIRDGVNTRRRRMRTPEQLERENHLAAVNAEDWGEP